MTVNNLRSRASQMKKTLDASEAGIIIETHHTIGEVIAMIERIKNNKDGKDKKVYGLGARMSKAEPKDRQLIVDKLIRVDKNLDLVDFPFSLEQLNNYIAFSEFLNLPKLNETKPIFQYLPKDGYSIAERNRRAAQKRRQMAEFNEHNRRAREKIAILKANRIKEKNIVETLAKEGIRSHRGSKIAQGSVNRLYHNYLEMVKNFDSFQHEAAGGAAIAHGATTPKRRKAKHKEIVKYFDADAMGENEVKVFNGFVELIFNKKIRIDFDFYLCFIARDGSTVADTLSINRHYISDNSLRINISEQTILSPGKYCIQMCLNPENWRDTSVDFLICDLERDMIELPEIRFVRNLNDDVVPVLRADSYHII